MNSSMMSLGITAAVLFAAYKFGTPQMKGAALGVAGFMVLNQIPVARDGVNVRLVA